MPYKTLLPIALALAAATCSRTPGTGELANTTRDGRLAPVLSNLGNYHRNVTTRSDDAQRFFDQGLILLYGFNHAESLRSFQEMARLDPGCGMAYWGQALALAPNINDPAIGPDREKQGAEAMRKAQAHKSGLTPVETGLIDALAARFSSSEPDRKQLNQDYSNAMKALYARFPADPDVGTLYADAVMNTMPWDYWSREDGKPRPGIPEAIAAIEAAIKVSPDHPGANHIYIHAVEASPNPDLAVPAADKLGSLVPGAGHLVHMPAHIYIRVGRYADGTEANRKAIAADESYITQCRAQGIYPAAYYPHNIHFMLATLSMEGRSAEALEAAAKVASRHHHDQYQDLGFGFPHLLRAMPLFAQVRFGKWEKILAEPQPAEEYKFHRVIWHFARGYAHLARNAVHPAAAELSALRKAAADPKLAEMKVFELNDLATLASIAHHMLAAEIAAARKNSREAVRLMTRAVAIEDGLLYSEPPDWPLPPRQYLGAILLNAGRYREAEQAFRADLVRHRNNGWALRGLALSLSGQSKSKDAAAVEERFSSAWARADIPLPAARL
jgi:tetratricopeptide (TPR) repeat protein